MKLQNRHHRRRIFSSKMPMLLSSSPHHHTTPHTLLVSLSHYFLPHPSKRDHPAVESHNGRYNPSQHRERYGYVDGIFARDVLRLKLFFRKNAHNIHMINAHDAKPLSKILRLTCSSFRYHSRLVYAYCRKDPHQDQQQTPPQGRCCCIEGSCVTDGKHGVFCRG